VVGNNAQFIDAVAFILGFVIFGGLLVYVGKRIFFDDDSKNVP
jgi:hypothetical protein